MNSRRGVGSEVRQVTPASWAGAGLWDPRGNGSTGCLSITDTLLESHKLENHHLGFLPCEVTGFCSLR